MPSGFANGSAIPTRGLAPGRRSGPSRRISTRCIWYGLDRRTPPRPDPGELPLSASTTPLLQHPDRPGLMTKR